jgi:RecA/RadA recombinase
MDSNNQVSNILPGLTLTNAFKLANLPEPRLTTGCEMLTDFLRGGFIPKKIYEIYGESGSGKTQFAV